MKLLCKLGWHSWVKGSEWRHSEVTLWGRPWPWGMNWLHRFKFCRRCQKRVELSSEPSKKVENHWGLRS